MSAKIDLKFLDFVDNDDFISVKVSEEYDEKKEKDVDFIRIDGVCFQNEFCIVLDKPTAIKFAKTLRTEINKIK